MSRFKYKLPYCSNRIITPCIVDVSKYVHKNEDVLECKRALWDTGATVTVVSEILIDQLGLVPTGVKKVAGYDGKPMLRNVYKVDIMLDADMRFSVNAIEAPLITTDVLIGMDIIVQGDFCLERCNDDQILRFEI